MEVEVTKDHFVLTGDGTSKFRSMAVRCPMSMEQGKKWYFPRNFVSYYHLMLHYPQHLKFPDEVIKEVFEEEKKLLPTVPGLKWDPKTPNYPYQTWCFNLAVALKRVALWLEQGLGKTKVALDTAEYCYCNGLIKSCLVLAPMTLVYTWESQIDEHSSMTSLVISGSAKRRQKLLKEKAHLHILNYEGARALTLSDLYRYDMLVLDESSNVANASAQQSKEAYRLARVAKRVLLLSGTPVGNSIMDLYGQYKVLDSSIFGLTMIGFRAGYCVLGGFKGKEIVGYQRVDDLLKKTRSISMRCTKAGCLDLPDKAYGRAETVMSEEQQAAYRQMKETMLATLQDGRTITATMFLTQVQKLQMIASGFVMADGEIYRFKEQPKAELLLEYCRNQVSVGTCSVIWAFFKESISIVKEALASKGWKCAVIDGSVSGEERRESERAFRAAEVPFLIGSLTKAAAMGLNLQDSCYTSYFYENVWDLRIRQQAEDRIHRIGQKRKVLILDLMCKSTVDGYIYKMLLEKKAFANVLADGVPGDVAEGKDMSLLKVLEAL